MGLFLIVDCGFVSYHALTAESPESSFVGKPFSEVASHQASKPVILATGELLVRDLALLSLKAPTKRVD